MGLSGGINIKMAFSLCCSGLAHNQRWGGKLTPEESLVLPPFKMSCQNIELGPEACASSSIFV